MTSPTERDQMTAYPECAVPAQYRRRPILPTARPVLLIFPGLGQDRLQHEKPLFLNIDSADIKQDKGSLLSDEVVDAMSRFIVELYYRNDHIVIFNDLQIAPRILQLDSEVDIRVIVPVDADAHRDRVIEDMGWRLIRDDSKDEVRVSFSPNEDDIDHKLRFVNNIPEFVEDWKEFAIEHNCPIYTCENIQQITPILFSEVLVK